MKIIKVIIFFSFILPFTFAQKADTIKVFFLYGSKPAHGCRHTEKHLFGGIHGGHVSIGIDSFIIGFNHVKGIHLFSRGKKFAGKYNSVKLNDFVKDTIACKYTTFEIPLEKEQYYKLNLILRGYMNQTPYDYAFFGMRCAAAAYDVLSQIGLFKVKSNFGNVFSHFYPKRLRKKMFILATNKQYKITYQQGKVSRRWERD